MAQSLNKIMLIGYVGRDAEVKYTNSGLAVMRFSLATDQNQKDQNGNWQRATTWHDIICFDKLAENMKEFVKKGRRVYVEGRLSKRDYVDKQNIKRYVVEVIAENLILLDRPGASFDDSSSVESETDSQISEPPAEDINSDSNSEEDLPF
ncbi:MAG: single-stranded DNA-binding protein [Ignavibacteria bacterium]|jgi:single-strand DNA-binding protein|nr:single-stranded DNA-binding protein [Ignavibacteria bacterium]MDH7528138.1 single-stranded DNA-binding protein [Ignavibacteria bacterium]NPV10347.1 single-stranded DNA-binding protein [Ignavibacteria bacterium]